MSENNYNGFNSQNNKNFQNDFYSDQSQTAANNRNDFYNNANGQNNMNNQYQNNMNNQNNYNNQYQNGFNNQYQNEYNNQYQNSYNNQYQNGFNNQYQNNYNMQSSSDFTGYFDQMDIENNKIISGLSYLGILFFLPLVAAPNSRFGKFHANQSLVLLISSVCVQILSYAFSFFYNILPWSLYKLLRSVPKLLSFVILIAFIYGLVTALMGKAKEIPVIGSIKIIK